jgi:condensation domain-containing protein
VNIRKKPKKPMEYCMQEKNEGYRLSLQQRRVWLLQQANGDAYYGQCAVSLVGKLRAEILRQAITHLTSRHEILRTTFQRRPGLRTPFQVISHSDSAAEWRPFDLSRVGSEERRKDVERLLAEERERPWEYEVGPLLRLRLARLSAQEHMLMVTLPALCSDSRTLSLFAEELAQAYTACLTNRDLLDEPTQYVQFSEWRNELLDGDEAAAGQAYWVGTRARNCACRSKARREWWLARRQGSSGWRWS